MTSLCVCVCVFYLDSSFSFLPLLFFLYIFWFNLETTTLGSCSFLKLPIAHRTVMLRLRPGLCVGSFGVKVHELHELSSQGRREICKLNAVGQRPQVTSHHST